MGNFPRDMMAAAEFVELNVVSVFPERVHEDATCRTNRQDIVSCAMGDVDERYFYALGS